MAENGLFHQVAAGLITAGANAASRIGGGPKRQYKYNKKQMASQNAMNRANAEWAYEKDLELRKFQMDYDSPQAQMQRLRDAGLNPNLIYGSGSAASGSFEPPQAPNVPSVTSHQVDATPALAGLQLGTDFQRGRLMAAQTDLTRTKTDESQYKQELIQAQRDLVRANPYLQKGYVESLVAQLRATADLKGQERDFMLEKTQQIVNGQVTEHEGPARGYVKMAEQLRLLSVKFELDKKRSDNLDADKKIKAEVIQSKEFRNALDKIQVEWMRDADITPQHIYQGIFMLIQSLMR